MERIGRRRWVRKGDIAVADGREKDEERRNR